MARSLAANESGSSSSGRNTAASKWVRRVWKHGGLAAVAVAVLVIIALTLNALLLKHTSGVGNLRSSLLHGADTTRERPDLVPAIPHSTHRRHMPVGQLPQVRLGGLEGGEQAAVPSTPSKAAPSNPPAKKAEVAPPAPTLAENPATATVGNKAAVDQTAPPAVAVSKGDVEPEVRFEESELGLDVSEAAIQGSETGNGAAAPATAAAVSGSSPSATISAPATATAPEVRSDQLPKPATVTALGALWRPENCMPRKDGKPFKMHLWFTHVQEANGRTYDYLFPKTETVAIHPGAGHVSHVDLRAAYEAFIVKSGDRCHLFSTILRNPIDRVISEYYVGLHRKTTSEDGKVVYDCNHSDCKNRDLVVGMAHGTMSLADYVRYNHTTRSPNNRFTYMLTSVAGIKNDPQLLPPEEARRVLDAAKDVLAQMPWFAVHEYISDSIFSMDATFGLQTKSFSLLSMKEREQVPTQDQIPPDVLAILREHNKLDLELYEFGLKIFATRVQTARMAAHLTSPARYACTNADCGAHVNERLNDESPMFAYRNAVAKPWHTLCQRSCSPLTPTVTTTAAT